MTAGREADRLRPSGPSPPVTSLVTDRRDSGELMWRAGKLEQLERAARPLR